MWQKLGKKIPTIVIILGVALLLRLPHLSGSFSHAEASVALESMSVASEKWRPTADLQPPLLYLLTYLAMMMGTHEWWLRLVVSVIPGFLTIWVTYALGHKLASKKVGLVAAIMLATSSFYIFYTQELQAMSLTAMWTVWSWFFLLESVRVGRDSYQLDRENKVNKFFDLFPISRDMFIYLLLTILGLYTAYLYILVWVSQIIFLRVQRKKRESVYSLLFPGVAFLTWIPTAVTQYRHNLMLQEMFPGWRATLTWSWWKMPMLTVGKFIYGVIDIEPNVFYGVMTMMILVLVVSLIWQQRKKFALVQKRNLILNIYMIAIPMFLAWVLNLLIPGVQPARIIYLLPFCYLLIGELTFAGKKKLSYSAWGLLIILLACNFFGTMNYYVRADYQREAWREMIADLHENYDKANTVIIFAYPAELPAWEWYEKDVLPGYRYMTINTGVYDTAQLESVTDKLQVTENFHHVVTLDYLSALTDSEKKVPLAIEEMGFQQTAQKCYANLGCVHIYTQPFGESKIERQV